MVGEEMRDDLVDTSENPQILRKYVDGTTVLRVSVRGCVRTTNPKPKPHTKLGIRRVSTGNDRTFDFFSWYKPIIFAELLYRYELQFLPLSSSSIPVEIALDGKPAIAAYIYLVDNFDSRWDYLPDLATRLDVSEDTVSQYLSDFVAGRR